MIVRCGDQACAILDVVVHHPVHIPRAGSDRRTKRCVRYFRSKTHCRPPLSASCCGQTAQRPTFLQRIQFTPQQLGAQGDNRKASPYYKYTIR